MERQTAAEQVAAALKKGDKAAAREILAGLPEIVRRSVGEEAISSLAGREAFAALLTEEE